MANRYEDLLNALPDGETYAAVGEVLPFLDRPHQFTFGPVTPGATFTVFFNDIASGTVVADGGGTALISSIPRLPPGEYDVKIFNIATQETRHFFITIKNLATWYAAYADVLNAMDDQIDEMDAARSLATVTPTYIEDVYGKAVRQPRPSLFRHEDYRNYLRQLRSAYRHFGAHPYGLSQAVEGMTSVSPLIVPDAWRPHWILGGQVAENGDFQSRTRTADAIFGPAGAVSTSPIPELQSLNRQSRVWIHPGVGTILVSSGFRDPPSPQQITVTTQAASQFVQLTGLDEARLLVAETVPDPSTSPTGGTYQSTQLFSKVLTAQRTGPGGQTASIGLASDRFIRLERLGDYNRPGTSPSLTYDFLALNGAPQLVWGGGDAVQLPVFVPLEGYGLSLTKHPGGLMTLGNANESFTGKVAAGQTITITKAANSGNNGTFTITKVAASVLTMTNPLAVDETVEPANSSVFHWLVNPSNESLTPFVADGQLFDTTRYAIAVGRRETTSTYGLDPGTTANPREYFDRLHLELDDSGIVHVYISAASATPATIASDINAAFNADPRYGAAYNAVASVLVGTEGDANSVVRLSSPTSLIPTRGERSRVKIHPGPADAAVFVFGLPRSSSYLLGLVSGYTLNCADTSRMPAVSNADLAPFNRRYKVRIRGLRFPETSGTLVANGSFDSTEMQVAITGYTFTSADVGGYVFWNDTDFGAPNNGMHRIIALGSGTAIIRHEGAAIGGLFHVSHGTGLSAGSGSIWGKGDIHTVVDNNVAGHTLSLDTNETAPFHWLTGSTVELVEEAPYEISGSRGLGEVDIEVDVRYRPYHDFGDSISYINGVDATGGMRITSLRANFTGQTGASLVIEGCRNLENDSSSTGFSLTATTSTTADFVNLDGIAETSSFEWHIDTPVSPVTDMVPIVGSSMPDGWQVTSPSTTVTLMNSGPTATDVAPGLLVPSRIALHQSTNGIISFRKTFDSALEWRGLSLSATFWLQEHTAASSTFRLEVSFDGTNFFSFATSTTVPASVLRAIDTATQFVGPLDPFEVSGDFFVPYNATTVIVRFTRTPAASAAGTISIEQFVLRSLTGTGLALGDNTIPRSEKRTKFGELLYVWSAENLTDEEKKYLGLPLDSSSVPATPGHIDYVTNAHGYWDRVDVTEVDDSGLTLVRNNIRGVFDSVDWVGLATAGGLMNMQAVIGTPSRASYARPVQATHIILESLVMIDGGDGPGYARADLAQVSNHEGTFPQAPNTAKGTGARLYEVKTTDTTQVNADGLITVIPAGALIPLPDAIDVDGVQPWDFTAGDQIRIHPPYFNVDSSYLLDYDVLMRATTQPFALASGGNTPADYVWLVDFARYLRHDIDEPFRTRVEQATFRADFTAVLSERADTTQPATLEVDDGSTIQTVIFSDWSFSDSKTIRINASVFNQNAIYTVTYVAKVPSIDANEVLTLEWRSGTDSLSILSNPWVEVRPNQVITPFFDPFASPDVTQNQVQPWHQVRVTMSGIVDARDIRVYSLGVKGAHLYGVSPHAPGIVAPEA